MAWKRGWKVLYQPRSVVYHEHRGTIGKRFRDEQIQAVLKKNFLLFAWKNIHEWKRLSSHFFFAWAGAVLSVVFGDVAGRPNPRALWGAFRQLRGAMRSRWRARDLARISDTEAFRRPLGGYFRDRFAAMEPAPERLRVLFVSPYPICPPVHGGGVFMYQALRAMARLAEVHVVELLDWPWQEKENLELREFCASAEWIVRPSGKPKGFGSLLPRAVREFANDDLEWLIHRQLYRKRIDVLQLEYTPMAQYRGEYRRIATALFEHDVYFQSIARGLGHMISAAGRGEGAHRIPARALLRTADAADLRPGAGLHAGQPRLSAFASAPNSRQAARRAARGHRHRRYRFDPGRREPLTMLFLGSFRHDPNRVALDWFIRRVLPLILARQPGARLVVAGSDPPPAHAYADYSGAPRHAGLRGGRARPAGPLRRVRLPDSERFGGAGEAAGGVRGRHSGGLDARGRRRTGAQGRRILRAGRRSGGLRGTGAVACSRIPARPPEWPRGPARRWNGTGTWPPSRRGWWRATANWCGGRGAAVANPATPRARLLQVALEAAYNVGGGAVELSGAGILGFVEYRPEHLP